MARGGGDVVCLAGAVVISQEGDAGCGAAAITNALAALGRYVSQSKVAKVAGTSAKHGTDEKLVMRALVAFGVDPHEFEAAGDAAYAGLVGLLEMRRPVLLCVDAYKHWIVAFGRLGNRIVIADSADLAVVRVVKKKRLLKRWQHKGRCYGIEVRSLGD